MLKFADRLCVEDSPTTLTHSWIAKEILTAVS